MSVVTVSWSLSVPVTTSQLPGKTTVSITGGTLTSPITQDVSLGTTQAVFVDGAIPPDDPSQPYTASVQLYDNSPAVAAIGAPATATFSIAAPAAIVQAPGAVTVALS